MKLRLVHALTMVVLGALVAGLTAPGAGGGAVSARAAAETVTPPRQVATDVVIDTDMGADDIMAILYLLQRPDVAVRAITVAGTGLAHCDAGTRHARNLVAAVARDTIPVACGRESPLQGRHHFPPDWRAAADGLYGLALPDASTPVDSDGTAAGLLGATLAAAPAAVVLVSLGPLTNLAEALEADPNLAQKVAMVYVMGGAVDVPGNVAGVPLTAPNRVAEWNIFVDPHAAGIVFNSGAPITLVPLDATNAVPITMPFCRALRDTHVTSAAQVMFDLFTAVPSLCQGGTWFWDPLTTVIATDNSIATFEARNLSIVEGEGEEIGRTKVAADGTPVRVALAADAARFEEVFLSTINGGIPVTINRGEPGDGQVAADGIVTSAGNSCSYDGARQVAAGPVTFTWVVEKSDHDKFGLVVATLDSDKGFDDLDAWPSTDPPPWLQVVGFQEAAPGSRSNLVVEVTEGPLYLVCFSAYPESKDGVLGPIEVAE